MEHKPEESQADKNTAESAPPTETKPIENTQEAHESHAENKESKPEETHQESNQSQTTTSAEQQESGVAAAPSSDQTAPKEQNVEESKSSEPKEEEPIVPRTLQEAKDALEKCKWDYHEHKLDPAYRAMKEFLSMERGIPSEDLPAYKELAKEQEIIFSSIESENHYLQQVVKELKQREGYKFDEIGKKSYIAYRVAENGLVAVKTEAEVQVPVAHLIAMINEVQLWKLWNALMTKTAEVGTIHRAAKVYYVEYGLPYPMSNREVHLYGIGVNRLHEDGTVMILAKSVDHDDEFFKKHNMERSSYSKKGSAHVDVHLGAFEITPMGRDKCILRGVTNLDPKFNWVPHKILNWALKKGTQQMVEKIIEGAKKFNGSPWDKEIKSENKREFYEWLDVQMEDYYKKEEAKNADKTVPASEATEQKKEEQEATSEAKNADKTVPASEATDQKKEEQEVTTEAKL